MRPSALAVVASRASGLFGALALLCSAIGCGGSDLLDVYPTTGTLLMDGEPFGPTAIHLIPLDEGGRMVVGEVDESGHVTFTSYKRGDGAPAGKYRVLAGMVMAAPPRPFPKTYQDPEQSPLTVTVEDKDLNELTIEMDSKAGPLFRGPDMKAASRMSAAQEGLMNPEPAESEE